MHRPILHFHAADVRVEEFNGDGVPLGLVPDGDYGRPRMVRLTPGDILLLVTDGFVEWARPDGEPYGLPRLREFVLTNSALGAQPLIERLEAEVRAFSAEPTQSDDMAAVVIRHLGL